MGVARYCIHYGFKHDDKNVLSIKLSRAKEALRQVITTKPRKRKSSMLETGINTLENYIIVSLLENERVVCGHTKLFLN